MLSLQHLSPVMAATGDNSPDLQRRRRPLSIIEENADEDPEGGESRARQLTGEERSATEPQASEGSAPQPAPKPRRTRKIGILNQQPPVLVHSGPHPLNHAQDTPVVVGGPGIVIEPGCEGDLTRLKDTATKLNLKTRRQSYLAWRAKYVDQAGHVPEVKAVAKSDDRLTSERKAKMDSDLVWIREQLMELRRQDRSLARQLLTLRHELSGLRLAASCEEHEELLQDARDELLHLTHLSRFADFPADMADGLLPYSPLRQVGVTRMNLSSRRFSTC